MKLKILAEAAAEFYQLPDLRVKQKIDKSQTKKARHNCQWIARDAGYSHSIIAWFWGMDRTSIYYACRMVEGRIDTDPSERRELKELLEFVRNRLTKTRQLSAARKASS